MLPIDELCDPERILQIDSKGLAQAEAGDEVGSEQWTVDSEEESDDPLSVTNHKSLITAPRAELLRKAVATVGKTGQPGEKIQNFVSVGMFGEGWDAKAMTHIVGLRAFMSSLGCEQG